MKVMRSCLCLLVVFSFSFGLVGMLTPMVSSQVTSLGYAKALGAGRIIDITSGKLPSGEVHVAYLVASELAPHASSVVLLKMHVSENGVDVLGRRSVPVEGATCLAMRDIDGDGHLDVVIGTRLNVQNGVIWGGEGKPKLDGIPGTAGLDCHACAIVGLDRSDGMGVYFGGVQDDIVCVSSGRVLSVSLESLSRFWGDSPELLSARHITRDVRASDVNGDGLEDLVVTRLMVAGGVTLHLAGADGGVSVVVLPVSAIEATGCAVLACGDRATLVMATGGINRISDYALSVGFLGALDGAVPLAQTNSGDVCVGDLDGDGSDEAIVAVRGGVGGDSCYTVGEDGEWSSLRDSRGERVLAQCVEMVDPEPGLPGIVLIGDLEKLDAYLVRVGTGR